jgi:UDP-3-O-[3-hydroxymyristoyl] glucosamine N-acyltransferase
VKLSELADRLGCRLDGDGSLDIVRVAGVDAAGPGDITFLANPKYAPAVQDTRASAIILAEDAEAAPCAMLRSPHPYRSFADALAIFARDERPVTGVHPSAVIAPDAVLGKDVAIGPLVVVERAARIGDRVAIHPHAVVGPEAIVGDDCVLHARVSLRGGSLLGARVVIQDGAVIGSDGFGFVTDATGAHHKIPQQSRVVVEDDVEIGANTTIDRARFGRTWIQEGVKIDNLVQIGHNVVIGKHSIIVAQVGIAGSVRIGSGVVIGGQAGIIGHIDIDDGTMIGAQSGVSKSLHGGTWWATPTVPLKEAKEQLAWVRRLGKLFERVKALEEKL